VLLPPLEGQSDAREMLSGRFQKIGLEPCTLEWNLRRWTLPQTMPAHLSPADNAVSAETIS
jgi:hypothetical protein